MVRSRTYNTVPGLNYIMDNELRWVTISMVTRSGRVHREVTTGAHTGTSEFYHDQALGTIEFPFLDKFNNGEKVFVEWEEF